MATQLEKPVEQHLIKRCKALGWYCAKFVSPASNGAPDRIVIVPRPPGFGDVWFLEIKKPDGEATPLQKYVHKEMRTGGARVQVLAGREQVDAWFEGLNI